MRFGLIATIGMLLAVMPPSLKRAHAQEPDGGYRFEPPQPPPLDGPDLDEPDEDVMEMGDEGGYRPPPPPPPMPQTQEGNGTANFTPPPQQDLRLPPAFSNSHTSGKLHFRVVDGEFWEKGKKRTRGKTEHVSPSDAR